MPLSTPRNLGFDTITRAFANVYLDEAQGTLEFGARIYNDADAARYRALNSSIRSNLTYLGPIEVTTPVSETFITNGVAEAAERRRQRELEQLRALEESNDDDDDTEDDDEELNTAHAEAIAREERHDDNSAARDAAAAATPITSEGNTSEPAL